MALSRHGRDFAYVGTLGERAITQVGKGKMVCGLSGCMDSGVVAVPLHEAIGDQLQCVFVDHGLLRKDEGEAGGPPVPRPLQHPAGPRRREQAVPRRARRHDRTREERKTIGALFIDVFEVEAKNALAPQSDA